MDDIEGLWNASTLRFLVVKSPLIGQIPGGVMSRAGWGANLTLDATDHVTDPDCDPSVENCTEGWHFE